MIKNKDMRSIYLRIAEQQGYTGEAAIRRAQEYTNKKFIVSQRRNPYFSTLVDVIDIIEHTDYFKLEDRARANELIHICAQRLGINSPAHARGNL